MKDLNITSITIDNTYFSTTECILQGINSQHFTLSEQDKQNVTNVPTFKFQYLLDALTKFAEMYLPIPLWIQHLNDTTHNLKTNTPNASQQSK